MVQMGNDGDLDLGITCTAKKKADIFKSYLDRRMDRPWWWILGKAQGVNSLCFTLGFLYNRLQFCTNYKEKW